MERWWWFSWLLWLLYGKWSGIEGKARWLLKWRCHCWYVFVCFSMCECLLLYLIKSSETWWWSQRRLQWWRRDDAFALSFSDDYIYIILWKTHSRRGKRERERDCQHFPFKIHEVWNILWDDFLCIYAFLGGRNISTIIWRLTF